MRPDLDPCLATRVLQVFRRFGQNHHRVRITDSAQGTPGYSQESLELKSLELESLELESQKLESLKLKRNEFPLLPCVLQSRDKQMNLARRLQEKEVSVPVEISPLDNEDALDYRCSR